MKTDSRSAYNSGLSVNLVKWLTSFTSDCLGRQNQNNILFDKR